MTIAKKFPIISTILATLFVVALLAFATPAHANPTGLQRSNQTATTSVVYMTPGTATTTYYYDAGQGNNFGADSAAFLVQLTGSSTPLSVLNVTMEYANPGLNGADCDVNPNACDWYRDTLYPAPFGTTTPTQTLSIPTSYNIAMASTTVGGAAGIAPRTTRIIAVPMPTRYVRAVLTLAIGGANGAVWGEFTGKKQVP